MLASYERGPMLRSLLPATAVPPPESTPNDWKLPLLATRLLFQRPTSLRIRRPLTGVDSA